MVSQNANGSLDALTAMRALSLEHPMATPRGSFIAGAVGMRTFLR